MLSIRDKILEVSKEKYRYCLLRIDFNKYIWGDWYYGHEIVNFRVDGRDVNGTSNVRVNRDELLKVSNLFVKKLINSNDIQFMCIANSDYKNGFISYGECNSIEMTPMNFLKNVNSAVDGVRQNNSGVDFDSMPHFQFKLLGKKSELCGFVHGYDNLCELTKNIVSNLDYRRIKVKIKL